MGIGGGGDDMKYKNPGYRKVRNAFPLEVSCGYCKMPILIYAKEGRGNLLKLQVPRVIASEINLAQHPGHLVCPSCGKVLARRGMYNGDAAYWVIRGKVNSKRLEHY